MKKTIITGSLVLATILGVSAADFLEVSKVVYQGDNTVVSYTRYSSESADRQIFWTMDRSYRGKLSAQDAVVRGSYMLSNNATSTSILPGTTPVAGQVDSLAQKRMEAYQSKGLVGYFAELARQLTLEI